MERGIAVYASQFGIPEDTVLATLTERFGARFALEAIEAAGGSAWVEDCLSLRDRSLLVLAALAAQGGVEERMRGHVRWAVDHGATRDELEAMVTLLANDIGSPKASVAMEVIRAELASIGS